MAIRFQCPGLTCRQTVSIDDAWAGRFIKCPGCGDSVEVPSEGLPAPALETGEETAASGAGTAASPANPDSVERLVGWISRTIAQLLRAAVARRERLTRVALAGMALCGAWSVVANILESRNIRERTAEICAVGEFRDAPVGDHSGDRVAYLRTTTEARTFFLKAAGPTAPVRLMDLRLDEMKHFSIFGWSPGDRFLAAGQLPDRLAPTPSLFLFNGHTGDLELQATNLPPMRNLTWLTTNTFAFFDEQLTCHRGAIAETGNPGKLAIKVEEIRRIEPLHGDPGLVAMESNVVGVVHRMNLHSLNLDTRELTRLSTFTNMTYQWLDYSPARKAFLFCAPAEPPRRFPRVLYRFDPTGNAQGVLKTLNDTHTYNGRWILNGQGYAYVGSEGNENFLTVHVNGDAEDRHLFEAGFIRAFSVDATQRRLLAFASKSIEPHGVWEYDIAGRSLKNTIAPTNAPFAAAKVLRPHNKVQRLKGRRPLPYTLIPPQDFKPGRKYPAVIDGPNSNRWRPEPQAIANAGIFYVSANRWGLASSDNFHRAAEDIAELHEAMTRHPSIDAGRIFLMGTSYGTRVMIPLIRDFPELWRGVILHSPVVNFELHADLWSNPPYLITIGENDRFYDEVRKFEIDACHHWTPVEVRSYPGMGHGVASAEHVRDRVSASIDFIRSR